MRDAENKPTTAPWPPKQAEAKEEMRPMAMQSLNEAARESAKSVLRHRARDLRYRAAQLDALCDALPERLPGEADEALWQLAINARNN